MPRRLRVGTAASSYPAWRQGLSAGTWVDIPNTKILDYYTVNPGGDPVAILSGWNGLARNGTEFWSAAQSGHGSWPNAVLKIDLIADQPVWTVIDQGSVFANVLEDSDFYADGRATGRHSYYSNWYVPSGVFPDGKARVVLPCARTRYSSVGEGGNSTEVFCWNIPDGQWDAAGDHPNSLMHGGAQPTVVYSCAQDPTTYDIYVQWADSASGSNLEVFRPSTNSWFVGYTYPNFTTPGLDIERIQGWDDHACWFDVLKQKIVAYHKPTYMVDRRWDIIDVSTAGTEGDPWLVTHAADTGDVIPLDITEMGFIHDTDLNVYYFLKSFDGVGSAKKISMWSVNPTTYEISFVMDLAEGSGLLGTDTVLQKAHYVPELKGIMLARLVDQNLMFYPTQ